MTRVFGAHHSPDTAFPIWSPLKSTDAYHVALLDAQLEVACPDYIRLRQHHEAALTHWEHVLSSQGALENPPPAVLEMKKKALEERNAAEERMILHQRTCPICIPR